MFDKLERALRETNSLEEKKKIRALIDNLEKYHAEEMSSVDMFKILKTDKNIKSDYSDKRYMYDLICMKKNGNYTVPTEILRQISTDVYCYGKAYVNYEKERAVRKVAESHGTGYFLHDEKSDYIKKHGYKAELINVEGHTSHFKIDTKNNTKLDSQHGYVKDNTWHTIESIDITEPTMKDVKENPEEFIRGIKSIAYNVRVENINDLANIINSFRKHELPIKFITRPKDDFNIFTLVWAFDNSFTKNKQIINRIKKNFKFIVLKIKELNDINSYIDVTNPLSFITMKNVIYFTEARPLNWKNIVSNYNALVKECNPFLYIDYTNEDGTKVSKHEDVQLYMYLDNFSANQENVNENKKDIKDINNNELLFKDIYMMGEVGGDWMYNKQTTEKHYTGLDLYRCSAKTLLKLAYVIENVYPYIMFKYNNYSVRQIHETLEQMIVDAKVVAEKNLIGRSYHDAYDREFFDKKDLLESYKLCDVNTILNNLEMNKSDHIFVVTYSKISRLYKNSILNWRPLNEYTGLTAEEVRAQVQKQAVHKIILVNVKAIDILLKQGTNRTEIRKAFINNKFVKIKNSIAGYFISLSDEDKEYFKDYLTFTEDSVVVKTCSHAIVDNILKHLEGKRINRTYIRAQRQLSARTFNCIQFKHTDNYKNIYNDYFYPLCTGKKAKGTKNNPLFNYFTKIESIIRKDLQEKDLRRLTLTSLDNYELIRKHINILRQLKSYVLQDGSAFLLPGLTEDSRQPISGDTLTSLRKHTDDSLEFFNHKVKKFEKMMYRAKNGYSQVSDEILAKINSIITRKTVSRETLNINGDNCDTSLLFYKLSDVLYTTNNRRLDKATRLTSLLDVLSSQKFNNATRVFEDKDLTFEYIKMLQFLKDYAETEACSNILDNYGQNHDLIENVFLLDRAYIKKFNRDLDGANKLNNTISKIITKSHNFLFINSLERLTSEFKLDKYKIDLVELMKKIGCENITNVNKRNLRNLEYSDLMILMKDMTRAVEFVPMITRGGYFIPGFNIDMSMKPIAKTLPFNQYIMHISGRIYDVIQFYNKYSDARDVQISDVIKNFYKYVTQDNLQQNTHEVELSGILAEMFKFYDSTDVKEITDDYLIMLAGLNPMYNKQSRNKTSSQDDRNIGSILEHQVPIREHQVPVRLA